MDEKSASLRCNPRGVNAEQKRGAAPVYHILFLRIFNLKDDFKSFVLFYLFFSTFISDALAVLVASRQGNN